MHHKLIISSTRSYHKSMSALWWFICIMSCFLPYMSIFYVKSILPTKINRNLSISSLFSLQYLHSVCAYRRAVFFCVIAYIIFLHLPPDLLVFMAVICLILYSFPWHKSIFTHCIYVICDLLLQCLLIFYTNTTYFTLYNPYPAISYPFCYPFSLIYRQFTDLYALRPVTVMFAHFSYRIICSLPIPLSFSHFL